MKAKRGCGWAIPWLLAAMSLLIAHPTQVIAAENTQQISLSLNAGESKVIGNLNKDSTPDIQIVSNPQALLVHSEEPGKLVLLGAETGEWKISVEQADGQKVTDPSSFIALIRDETPGTQIQVVVDRDGTELTVTVTVGERPSDLVR